jgi:hypothetical protein
VSSQNNCVAISSYLKATATVVPGTGAILQSGEHSPSEYYSQLRLLVTAEAALILVEQTASETDSAVPKKEIKTPPQHYIRGEVVTRLCITRFESRPRYTVAWLPFLAVLLSSNRQMPIVTG